VFHLQVFHGLFKEVLFGLESNFIDLGVAVRGHVVDSGVIAGLIFLPVPRVANVGCG
jgi:hypothetical protein